MLGLVYLLGLIIYMMELVCLHYRIILVTPHLSGMSLVGTCMHTYLLELAQCLCIYEWILLILWFLNLHAYLIAAHVIPLPCLILLHAYAIYIYIYIYTTTVMILDHTYVCSAYGSDCLLLPIALPVPLFGPCYIYAYICMVAIVMADFIICPYTCIFGWSPV